jgi:Holliday junction resolvase RusA-like endonuclease
VSNVVLDIVGVPAPQGSKTAFNNPTGGRPIMREGSLTGYQKLKDWRHAVSDAAAQWSRDNGSPPPIATAAEVRVTFFFVRPKSYPKRASHWKTTKPDVDKLLRSTLDALVSGGVLAADQLVSCVTCRKVLTTERPPGAHVTVSTLIPEQADL